MFSMFKSKNSEASGRKRDYFCNAQNSIWDVFGTLLIVSGDDLGAAQSCLFLFKFDGVFNSKVWDTIMCSA